MSWCVCKIRRCICLVSWFPIVDEYVFMECYILTIDVSLYGLVSIVDVHVWAECFPSSIYTQWTTYLSSLTCPSSMYMSSALVSVVDVYFFMIASVRLSICIHYPPFVDISFGLDVFSLSIYSFHERHVFCTHRRCTDWFR